MSWPMIFGCLWVLVAVEHGWWLTTLGLAAFCSMFRHPLIFLFRLAMGERPEVPR